MKFKHYATDEIIELEEETKEIVFCKKQNKYYKLEKDKEGRVKLKKTSFVLVT